MTLFLADIASYQKTLTCLQLRAAGFTGVNVKISHGLTQKSVHPNVQTYVRDARELGMELSCFHWLDGSARGDHQADYAYRQMRLLGLNVAGVAHVCDCESDASQEIYRDYVVRMTELLGRPIVTYSGDWWWMWLDGLTPWLWAAPNPGYVPAYPGDDSPLWDAGWGGWNELAVMQYRVSPIGGINVSQSAVRNPELWREMTGGTGMASQAYWDWVEDGSPWKFSTPVAAMGNKLREHGYTVYFQGNESHLKKAKPEDHTPFSATGWPGKSPYPYCMAGDIMPPSPGQKSKLTGKPLPSLQALGKQLFDDKQSGFAGARFLKYMNWEPEANYNGPCYHDMWMPDHERIGSTDRGHIHYSCRSDFYLSMTANGYDLVARTLGDDMPLTEAEYDRIATEVVEKFWATPYGSEAYPTRSARALARDLHAERDYAVGDGKGAAYANVKAGSFLDIVGKMAQQNAGQVSALLAAIQDDEVPIDPAEVALALLPALTAAILAELPDGTLTAEEIQAASERGVRNVLRSGVDE